MRRGNYTTFWASDVPSLCGTTPKGRGRFRILLKMIAWIYPHLIKKVQTKTMVGPAAVVEQDDDGITNDDDKMIFNRPEFWSSLYIASDGYWPLTLRDIHIKTLLPQWADTLVGSAVQDFIDAKQHVFISIDMVMDAAWDALKNLSDRESESAHRDNQQQQEEKDYSTAVDILTDLRNDIMRIIETPEIVPLTDISSTSTSNRSSLDLFMAKNPELLSNKFIRSKLFMSLGVRMEAKALRMYAENYLHNNESKEERGGARRNFKLVMDDSVRKRWIKTFSKTVTLCFAGRVDGLVMDDDGKCVRIVEVKTRMCSLETFQSKLSREARIQLCDVVQVMVYMFIHQVYEADLVEYHVHESFGDNQRLHVERIVWDQDIWDNVIEMGTVSWCFLLQDLAKKERCAMRTEWNTFMTTGQHLQDDTMEEEMDQWLTQHLQRYWTHITTE